MIGKKKFFLKSTSIIHIYESFLHNTFTSIEQHSYKHKQNLQHEQNTPCKPRSGPQRKITKHSIPPQKTHSSTKKKKQKKTFFQHRYFLGMHEFLEVPKRLTSHSNNIFFHYQRPNQYISSKTTPIKKT
jgi:hypothetical protein